MLVQKWRSGHSWFSAVVCVVCAVFLLVMSGCGGVKKRADRPEGAKRSAAESEAPGAVERETTEGVVIGMENADPRRFPGKPFRMPKPPSAHYAGERRRRRRNGRSR